MIYRHGIYAQRYVSGGGTLIPGDGTTSWIDVVGAVTTSLGKIVPSSSVTGWDKGGSFGVLPASTDGYVEFNVARRAGVGSGGNAMLGLATTTGGGVFSNINFAIYFNGTSDTQIYELGTLKSTGYSAYNIAYKYRVERVGTTIYYKIDTGGGFSTFYTSLVSSSGALYFDCSLFKDIGAENLKIVY